MIIINIWSIITLMKFRINLLIKIFFILLFSYPILSQHITKCDNLGKCTITTSNNNVITPQPNSFVISPSTLSSEPIYQSDQTEITILPQGDLKGISEYGTLKKSSIGYECSGGLDECVNSCCLNGYCVKLQYICEVKKEQIGTIYILTTSMFALLIVIYWSMFFYIGYPYNKKRPEIPQAQIHFESRQSAPNSNITSSTGNYLVSEKNDVEDLKSIPVTVIKKIDAKITEVNEEANDDSSYTESIQEHTIKSHSEEIKRGLIKQRSVKQQNIKIKEHQSIDEAKLISYKSQKLPSHPIDIEENEEEDDNNIGDFIISNNNRNDKVLNVPFNLLYRK